MDRKDVITFAGGAITLAGEETKVGDKANDFSALNAELKEVKLSDFAGKVVILSSMPSVDTGVCAFQTAEFNKAASELGSDVQILTLSCDLPFALGRFCAAEGIENALTLSDHRDLDFGQKYGFVMKELRLLARGVVVINKNGVIEYVEYVPEVTNHPDYDKAIAAAKACLS